MTEYRTFYIDRHLRIFRKGKQLFTHFTQTCATLDEAKAMIDHSLEANERAAAERLRKLPDLNRVKDLKGHCELENGAEAREDSDKWMDGEAERQLNEHENC